MLAFIQPESSISHGTKMFKTQSQIALALVGLLCGIALSKAANSNSSELARASLKPVEPCMLDAVVSFLYERSYPPTSQEALGQMCRRQSDAFKCIKDRGKSTPALVRRGLLSFVSSRQRANKKYCTNQNSEQSRKLVQDFKCIMDRRFTQYKAIDTEYTNTINLLPRRQFNDTGLKLKYFCCATYKYRRDFMDSVGAECSQAKQSMSDIINSIVPSDINLICEDEDKLTKVCSSELAPLKISREFDPANSPSPSATGLLLVATLGEPE